MKNFIERWSGQGYEKGDTQKFWLEFLQNVLGVENPGELIDFEKKVKAGHVNFIDGYIASTQTLIEHHVFCDGLAKCIFLYDLDKVYAGQEIEQDAWLSYLEQRENAKLLPHYRESKLYYENLYGDAEWSKYPKTDFEGNGKNEQGFLFRDIDFSDNDWQILGRGSKELLCINH